MFAESRAALFTAWRALDRVLGRRSRRRRELLPRRRLVELAARVVDRNLLCRVPLTAISNLHSGAHELEPCASHRVVDACLGRCPYEAIQKSCAG